MLHGGRGGGTGGYGRGRVRYDDPESIGNGAEYLIDFDAIEAENIANADVMVTEILEILM